jgi:hypothetical protein
MSNNNKIADFLTVYGWAILVCLAAIGALLYFGLFSDGPNKIINTDDISYNVLSPIELRCGSLQETMCGITLRNCNNTSIIYSCYHDVIYEVIQ